MKTIKLTAQGGLVVRKAALTSRKIKISQILQVIESYTVLDESADLISIGPIFPDALDECIQRIKGLGLEYVDDFFELAFDLPDWIRLHGSLKTEQ